MCIVCLFTVGVQHGADHHLHGVRHQDEKSTWKLQRGQVHRVHDVHHLHHLVGLCATLLRHRKLLWGGLTCYYVVQQRLDRLKILHNWHPVILFTKSENRSQLSLFSHYCWAHDYSGWKKKNAFTMSAFRSVAHRDNHRQYSYFKKRDLYLDVLRTSSSLLFLLFSELVSNPVFFK